ncbi:unnamed protein product [Spirodela intermedia]|uniref:Protein kinase domain-containing protein n=1 Tax=Spirodela intermedia TaxID=51605 RepID=A0A7I8JST7_SPIIN|nr:unnamed protein product [Spirodela intermedia]CAA6673189.1 unnamed protein product [Spirodela intermedia]
MTGWVRGPVVGRGSFGTVHLARCPPAESTCVEALPPVMAVKSCPLAESASLRREKVALDCLAGCPEILTCYGAAVTVEPDGRRLYNILLEYLPGGSLADLLLHRRRRPLPEAALRSFSASLLRGLRRIHQAGLVHCDIKPQNLLVTGDGRAKIADFGLSKPAAGGSAAESSQFRGTPLYMAPESVQRGEYEPPADIWALGCVVAEMASGEPAWRHGKGCADAASLMFLIGSGESSPEIPEVLSEQGRDFLRKCFVRSPGERWTAEMLLCHSFVESSGEEQVPVFGDVDDDEVVVTGKWGSPWASPRSVFGFPTWASAGTPLQRSQGGPSSPAPASRLRCLTAGSCWPISFSEDSHWVTVREGPAERTKLRSPRLPAAPPAPAAAAP